jgi:hypothetical protein
LPEWLRPWLTWRTGFIALAAVLLLVLVINRDPSSDGLFEQFDPEIAPVEFHYLDNERAAAYLAQLQGGASKLERVTQTLKDTVGAKAALGGLEAQASVEEQRFVEREVTPTAASIFFQLFDALDDGGYLQRLRDEPQEGDFVLVEGVRLQSPYYISPFLVVNQATTLATILPLPEQDPARVERQRDRARTFAEQIGDDPRMVFSFRDRRTGDKFLLPMRYEQLTDERSLIKDGGGEFTVVGKLVRMFREDNPKQPEYKDSPTRETWIQPLERAPRLLLVRSSMACQAPGVKRPPEGVEPGIKYVKTCLRTNLVQQTRISKTGGVILPVAIFK